MEQNFNAYKEFPRNHFLITPSDATPIPSGECTIYCGTAGDIRVADDNGVAITYTVTAGTVLPVIVSQVLATGTTVTQVIGLR